MRVVVALPHRDLSLTAVAPEHFELVDTARAFVDRALTPTALLERAEKLDLPETAGSPRTSLMLRAAADLLARPGGSLGSRLRAYGTALQAISEPPSPVRLRLDDLDLSEGTTERSVDLLASARAGTAPYTPELDAAAVTCRQATLARLWVEADQQLPAALQLARSLDGAVKLELAGTFALTHRAALSTLGPFSKATFVDAPPQFQTRFEPFDSTRWSLHRDQAPTGAPWAGYVPLEAVCSPSALLKGGCRAAVVAFCEVGEDVLDDRGTRLPLAALREGARRLLAAGVAVVGEWWLGAPGVTAEAVEATWRHLEEAPFFGKLAGLRVFHWAREREASSFGGRAVELLPIPEGHDLARSRPFRCEGTLDSAGLTEQIQKWAQILMERGALGPGRIAAAYLEQPATPPDGEGLRLDPDCALVQTPRRLDGSVGPGWYAVQLRTGKLLALDGKVASTLGVLRVPLLPAVAWPGWPEATRAKVAKMLVEKQVLQEVRR